MSSTENNIGKTIIFLHTPKTAGTTLKTVIGQQYSPKDICLIDDKVLSLDAFKALPDEKKRAYRVIQGHMRFGLHEFLPQPSTYITIMRDPVDRVISNYFHVAWRPEHRLHTDVKDMSIEEYVVSGLSKAVDNDQTRGLYGFDSAIIDFGRTTADMLQTAQDHFDRHFALVGLAERFDESLLLMQRLFGWKLPFYTRRNVTRNRPPVESLSDETIAFIREHNRFDQSLYDYACRKFDQLVAAQGTEFDRAVQRFRALNLVWARPVWYYRRLKNRLGI